jgi:hypothetical protein
MPLQMGKIFPFGGRRGKRAAGEVLPSNIILPFGDHYLAGLRAVARSWNLVRGGGRVMTVARPRGV